MPQIGDISYAEDLGHKGNPRQKYIWSCCPDCKSERWIRIIHDKPNERRCSQCNANEYGRNHYGDKSGNWRGGRSEKGNGYVHVWVSKDDFYYGMMTKTGRILEHRLVMAKHLGRCLNRWEFVHHKNGIKNDNRIENLEITTGSQHSIQHGKGYRDGYTKGLTDGRTKQIQELQAEIVRLNTIIFRKAVNREV